MNATHTDDKALLDALPQQPRDEPSGDNLAQLTELASAISARVTSRTLEHEAAAEQLDPLILERDHRRHRILATVLPLLAMAGVAAVLTMLFLAMHGRPARTPSAARVPTVTATTARDLGTSAGRRLAASGKTADGGSCLSEYAGDAAASPLLLPPKDKDSPERRAYLAACTTVHSSK